MQKQSTDFRNRRRRTRRRGREVNAGKDVDIPTGVGFCTNVRRACLDEIGLFDVEKFGSAYGEEIDLCRRAPGAGWRKILAPNIFVHHYGGTSYGGSKFACVCKAIETVEALHPGYLAEVREFIRADPVRPWGEALDIARLSRRAKPKGAVLFVNHVRGGGTERHAQDLAALLEHNGSAVFSASRSGPFPTLIPNLTSGYRATILIELEETTND